MYYSLIKSEALIDIMFLLVTFCVDALYRTVNALNLIIWSSVLHASAN